MAAYICNDPINHDGELYCIGDSLVLDDKHATPLLVIGAIAPDPAAVKAPKVPKAPKEPETSGDSSAGESAKKQQE